MSQNEKIFADGFNFNRRENAPEWVVGEVSILVDEAIKTIKSHAKKNKDGQLWLNLKVNISQKGNPYMEVDTFVPDSSKRKTTKVDDGELVEEDVDELPF